LGVLLDGQAVTERVQHRAQRASRLVLVLGVELGGDVAVPDARGRGAAIDDARRGVGRDGRRLSRSGPGRIREAPACALAPPLHLAPLRDDGVGLLPELVCACRRGLRSLVQVRVLPMVRRARRQRSSMKISADRSGSRRVALSIAATDRPVMLATALVSSCSRMSWRMWRPCRTSEVCPARRSVFSASVCPFSRSTRTVSAPAQCAVALRGPRPQARLNLAATAPAMAASMSSRGARGGSDRTSSMTRTLRPGAGRGNRRRGDRPQASCTRNVGDTMRRPARSVDAVIRASRRLDARREPRPVPVALRGPWRTTGAERV
jgi:hypothetical protein